MSKFVVITGVSSGIGRDTLRKLSEESYHVISTVRNESDRQEVLQAYPNNHSCIVCDITKPEDLDNFMDQFDKIVKGQQLFAIINNAGIAVPGPMHILSDEKFYKQMDVNLISTRKITNRLIPYMGNEDPKLKPKIIFISSISGIIASPFNGSYCVSKHALECMIDIYRRELHYLNIDVVSIQPGPIKTKIWSKAIGSFEQYNNTVFKDIAVKADDMIRNSERSALDVEIVSNKIHTILMASSPKIRYLIHRKPMMITIVGKLLPARILDKLMWKTLGKKDSKKYRPV